MLSAKEALAISFSKSEKEKIDNLIRLTAGQGIIRMVSIPRSQCSDETISYLRELGYGVETSVYFS